MTAASSAAAALEHPWVRPCASPVSAGTSSKVSQLNAHSPSCSLMRHPHQTLRSAVTAVTAKCGTAHCTSLRSEAAPDCTGDPSCINVMVKGATKPSDQPGNETRAVHSPRQPYACAAHAGHFVSLWSEHGSTAPAQRKCTNQVWRRAHGHQINLDTQDASK